MVKFDSSNPYPLLPRGSASYADSQMHAIQVDQWLGLKTDETESRLKRLASATGQQLWIGLPVQTLLTPYLELRAMLCDLALPLGSTIVDLGAGYGRMAFVMGRHHPELQFIGYEWVEERVQESRRCLKIQGLSESTMKVADLSSPSFKPPIAEAYFLYDFGTREAIEKILQDLREIAAKEPIQVVGRGRASRDAIERGHPWLSQVCPPRHFGNYSIYSCNF